MFKATFANLSRHAGLAKTVWASSSNSQPAFFISTNHYNKQQQQVQRRLDQGFGRSGHSHSSFDDAEHYTALINTAPPTVLPLSALDDDHQRDSIERRARAATNSVRVSVRRYSTSSRREPREALLLEDADADALSNAENIVKLLESSAAQPAEAPNLSGEAPLRADDAVTESDVSDWIDSVSDSVSEPYTNSVLSAGSAGSLAEHKPAASPQLAPLVSSLETEILNLAQSDDPQKNEKIVALYHDLDAASTETYNQVLKAAFALGAPARSPDDLYSLDTLVDVYSKMMLKNVLPNTKSYTIMIKALTTAAVHAHSLSQKPAVYKSVAERFAHGGHVLPAVQQHLDSQRQAFAYLDVALDLLKASNVSKVHEYKPALYMKLVKTCVALSHVDRLPWLLELFNWKLEVASSNNAAALILGCGLLGDMPRAIQIYKEYARRTVVLAENNFAQEFDIYAALISAYFLSGLELEGVQFFEKIIAERSALLTANKDSLALLVDAVVSGFVRRNDYESAWRWVRKIETDIPLVSVSVKSVIEVLNLVTKAGNPTLADQVFDYLAARTDSAQHAGLNDARCDITMLAVRSNNDELLMKLIRESHLRGGVWDASTLVSVVNHLLIKDTANAEFAFNVFNSQISRIEMFGPEATGEVVALFAQKHLLNANTSVMMASTRFGLSAVEQLAESIWETPLENVDDRTLALIVQLHYTWISASASSLGGLTIDSELLSGMRDYFKKLVVAALNRQCGDISQLEICAEALGLPMPEFVPENLHPVPVSQPLIFEQEASNAIIALAHAPTGLLDAYNRFDAMYAAKTAIDPKAVSALVEGAAACRKTQLLELSYEKAHSLIPHPGHCLEAWTSWRDIHRTVVRCAAELDYSLARKAHSALAEMGSHPDAAGYTALISHIPPHMSHDEASLAVLLFQETRSVGIQPSTLLYNALLCKLSKARRLKEAMAYFMEMEVTGAHRNSVTYGTLIQACCRSGDTEDAEMLFSQMEAASDYTPKVSPYNTMLQHYIHANSDRASAEAVYEKMKKNGVKPSAHTYKLLIDMYGTIEPIEISKADEVLLKIVEDGATLSTQHYAALIFCRGVSMRNLDAVKTFYGELTMKGRIRPDENIFQAMLESYVVNGAVQETGEVLQEMMNFGVDISAYMANILIRGWAPVNMTKSIGLFDHIVNVGLAEPSTFEAMVRAYLFNNDLANAQSCAGLMRSFSYPEPVVSKVEGILKMKSPGGDILLESIFRQNAQRLDRTRG